MVVLTQSQLVTLSVLNGVFVIMEDIEDRITRGEPLSELDKRLLEDIKKLHDKAFDGEPR